MSETRAALAYCPFPDRESARTIAATLLDEKLIACANLLPGVESLFEYEGRCESETEIGALFKTVTEKADALIARLGELHPYETPAIVAWRCDTVHPATLEWFRETTQGG